MSSKYWTDIPQYSQPNASELRQKRIILPCRYQKGCRPVNTRRGSPYTIQVFA